MISNKVFSSSITGFVFVFVCLFLFLRGTFAAFDLASDAAALLVFHAAVAQHTFRWAPTASPCSWKGVVCGGGAAERVTELHLPGAGLRGSVPEATLGNLTALRTLSLRFNTLAAPLPRDIAACAELRVLSLRGNRISGEFPPAILDLRDLILLDLAGNLLSGPIPTGLANLSRIRALDLDRNRLTGEIPDLDLPSLVSFNVSHNPLSGPIPPAFRHMPPIAFLGTDLCGAPLAPCPSIITPAPPLAPAPAPAIAAGELSRGEIAAIAIGSVVVLLCLVMLFFVLLRLCRGGTGIKSKTLPTDGSSSGGEREKVKKLMFVRRGGGDRAGYDIEDLMRASAKVLGKGTFGTTYKAAMETEESEEEEVVVVAVKRLREVHLQEKEFQQQVTAIGALEHPNLLPLRAYYYSKQEKLLVYDFMAWGSLSSMLHGNKGSGRMHLDLEARSSVALAAARGVEYIHSAGPNSSHGNIKSSNILLSGSSSYSDARIADHGLAHLISPAAAATSTPIHNNAAYRAPEITDIRRASQKADVYSFGILLLELLTGKSAAGHVDLLRWVRAVLQEEWTQEVFDAELTKARSSPAVAEEVMMHLLKLALDCTAQLPNERPAMADVVARIEKIRAFRSASKERELGDHNNMKTNI